MRCSRGGICSASKTVSDTLAGVLKTDPDWKALPAETPPAIRKLLRRCLVKDEKLRLRDIGDALLEIDEARVEPDPPAVTASPKPILRLFPWIAATVLLALALRAVWLLRPKPESACSSSRFPRLRATRLAH